MKILHTSRSTNLHKRCPLENDIVCRFFLNTSVGHCVPNFDRGCTGLKADLFRNTRTWKNHAQPTVCRFLIGVSLRTWVPVYPLFFYCVQVCDGLPGDEDEKMRFSNHGQGVPAHHPTLVHSGALRLRVGVLFEACLQKITDRMGT